MLSDASRPARLLVFDDIRGFFQPHYSLVPVAVRHDPEHLSVIAIHTAKAKYAVLPDVFQRISKYGILSALFGVGGIEHNSGFAL